MWHLCENCRIGRLIRQTWLSLQKILQNRRMIKKYTYFIQYQNKAGGWVKKTIEAHDRMEAIRMVHELGDVEYIWDVKKAEKVR